MYAVKQVVFFALTPLLCSVSAFAQADALSLDSARPQPAQTIFPLNENRLKENPIRQIPSLGDATLSGAEYFPDGNAASESLPQPKASPADSSAPLDNMPEATMPDGDAKDFTPIEKPEPPKPGDFNRQIYYRNKLEFSLDAGWLPINVPFPLDIFVGDAYNTYTLKYTLAPIFASLRWHMTGVSGPIILRGNWDLTCTGSITAVPRGPESRYFSWIMGIRRNFVPRNSRVAPYFDIRLGLGHIDAQGPKGVLYAQGQDFTFTVNMGSGVRYNLSPRYGLSAGLNFMHISNLDLSESNGKPNWGVRNYGINVYGPMVGIDIQLRKHRRTSE